jgi:hypothetical protein
MAENQSPGIATLNDATTRIDPTNESDGINPNDASAAPDSNSAAKSKVQRKRTKTGCLSKHFNNLLKPNGLTC